MPLRGGLFRVSRMQRHEQHDPEPKPERPDPRGTQTKWLLLAIAVLLAVIAGRLLDRLF
jgi:hypothetical protein